MENISFVLHGKNDVRMEQVPIPEPGVGEVQLKVLNCGLCGTDPHLVKEFCLGPLQFSCPFVLGHEASGQVTKLGEAVHHLKVGDRVTLEGGVPCTKCVKCKTGKYNLCKSLIYKGIGRDGSLTRVTTNQASFCYKLPDIVSDEEGAMVEPLSVAVRACRRSTIQTGDTVLVIGAGTIGLLAFQTARAHGAKTIMVTDLSSERLEVARRLGADYTLNVRGKNPVEAARLVEDTLGGLADVTLECCGVPAGIATAIYATTSGGIVTLVGIGDLEMNVPLGVASLAEMDIRGSIGITKNDYQDALSLLADQKVDMKPLITHRYKLQDVLDAYKMVGAEEAIKVTVRCAE